MMRGSGLARATGALLAIALLSAPAAADGIFVVFENPGAGALPVNGAPLDDEMAKLGALKVDTLEFGIENTLVIGPGAGAGGRGSATFQPLRMGLRLGPGIPALLQTAGAGGQYADVTVHFRTGGRRPVDHATLALKLVAVTGVEVSAAAGAPQATVTLTYGAMKLDVYAQDAKGEIATTPETGQWNALTGTADFSATR